GRLCHAHQRGTEQAFLQPVARLVLLDHRVRLVLGALDVRHGLVLRGIEGRPLGLDPLDAVPLEHVEQGFEHQRDALDQGLPVAPALRVRDGALQVADDGEQVSVQALGGALHGLVAHGRSTGLLAGPENSRRRFAGSLEPLLLIRAVFGQRPTSDLVFLLRCELEGTLRAFTRDLDCFAAGSYVLELTDRMVFGRESGHEVYRLALDALTLLDAGAPADPVLRAFELHLLAASGYAPALDRCRACGRAAEREDPRYLTLERGGLVCRR